MPGPQAQALQAQMQRAQGVGDAYRSQSGPPAQPSRIFRDATGRETGRSYAPGTLPPPQAPYFPPDVDSPQPAGAAPPPPAGSGVPMRAQTMARGTARGLSVPPAEAMPSQPSRQARPDVTMVPPERRLQQLDRLAYDDMTREERADAMPRRTALGPASEGGSPLPSYVGQAGRGPNAQQLQALMSERRAPRRVDALEGEVSQAAGPKPPGNAPPDYTAADTLDAIRRPMRGIANALRVFGGGSADRSPIASEGQAARARDAAAASSKQQTMARNEAGAMDEREMSLRERQQGALEADRSQRAQRLEAQGAAMDRYRQRSSEIAAMRADGAISEQQARTAEIQARTELFQARQDPNSAVSQRARQAVEQQVELRGQARNGEQLNPTRLDGLAAAEAERVGQGVNSITTPRLPGRRGAGGGGNASPGGGPQGLINMPNGWTQGPDAWLALPESERARLIGRHGFDQPESAEEEGYDLIPGVRATIGGDPDARAFRTRYTQAGEAMDALGRLEAVARRAGPSARIDPTIAAEIAPDMLLLRGMAAQRQGSGVINPGELPVINAAIPDPQSLSGQLLGTLATNARVWRSSVVDGVLRHADSLGASDIEAVRRGIMTRGGSRQGGGAPRAQAAPQGDTVAVIAPDGRRGRVPRARLQDAISRGYQEAP
jgi:hypothetical protein